MLSEKIARAIDSHPRTRAWGRHPGVRFISALASGVLHRQSTVQIGLSAAGVAFWFVISLFPALIAILVVLGLVLDPSTLNDLIRELETLSPGSLSVAILTQVQSVAASEPSSFSLPLILSLTFSAWSTSSGVYNLSRGVRLAYGLPARTYVRARAVAFGGSYLLILIFAVLMIAITSASAWGSTLDPQFHAIFYIGLFAVAILVIIGLVSALYFFAIGRGQTRSTLLPGAIFSGVGTVGLYIGLGIFLRFSTGYEAVYGALAGVIIVMMVFYVASYVFLLGAVINGQWYDAKDHARSSLSDPKN